MAHEIKKMDIMEDEKITTKEIITTLKEEHLMVEGYEVDKYIRQIYDKSSCKEVMQEYRDGLISFVKHNVEYDAFCITKEEKIRKVREIIKVNYPYTEKGRKKYDRPGIRNLQPRTI